MTSAQDATPHYKLNWIPWRSGIAFVDHGRTLLVVRGTVNEEVPPQTDEESYPYPEVYYTVLTELCKSFVSTPFLPLMPLFILPFYFSFSNVTLFREPIILPCPVFLSFSYPIFHISFLRVPGIASFSSFSHISFSRVSFSHVPYSSDQVSEGQSSYRGQRLRSRVDHTDGRVFMWWWWWGGGS